MTEHFKPITAQHHMHTYSPWLWDNTGVMQYWWRHHTCWCSTGDVMKGSICIYRIVLTLAWSFSAPTDNTQSGQSGTNIQTLIGQVFDTDDVTNQYFYIYIFVFYNKLVMFGVYRRSIIRSDIHKYCASWRHQYYISTCDDVTYLYPMIAS